jgi:hypothetical protein
MDTHNASTPPRLGKKHWGALVLVRHEGAPSLDLHKNVRDQFAQFKGVVDRIHCTFGKRDALKLKGTRKTVNLVLRTIRTSLYGKKATYETLVGDDRSAVRPKEVRRLDLGVPWEGPLAGVNEPRIALIHLVVGHVEGRRHDDNRAWKLFHSKVGGQIVRAHKVLDPAQDRGILVEVAVTKLSHLDKVVSKVIPGIAEFKDSETLIAIQLAAPGARATWGQNLRTYFEKLEPGVEKTTSEVATALNVRGKNSTLHTPLALLEEAGFLASRKGPNARIWRRV